MTIFVSITGRRDVFAVVTRHLWRTSEAEADPAWILYDFVCSLNEFTYNRNPALACDMRFYHDRWVLQKQLQLNQVSLYRHAHRLSRTAQLSSTQPLQLLRLHGPA